MSNAIYNTNQEIPQEMLLGNLVFINLTDMKIPDTDLKQIFASNGITKSYVRDISQADAFRRASSSVKNKKINIINNNGQLKDAKLEVDEVRCDENSIKRIIGMKLVDQINEDIAYEPVAEIVFNRSMGTCTAIPTVSSSDQNFSVYETICKDCQDKYQEWSMFHNKDTVRNIINRIIADTHPINLMPTGLCKFSPSSKSNLLYSLKASLNDMSSFSLKNTENIMEIIPIIDTKEQRDLVNKNFQMEISDELLGLAMELKNVLQKKQKISSRSAASYIEKYKMYQDKIQDYESLLNVYAGSLHAQLQEVVQLVDDGQNDDSNV